MIRKLLLGLVYVACVAPVLETVIILVMYVQACLNNGGFLSTLVQPAIDPDYRIIWFLFSVTFAPALIGSPVFIIAIILKWRKVIHVQNAYLIVFAIGSIFFSLWFWCDLFGLQTLLWE